MPHAELKYSDDLNLNAVAILQGIERIIQAHDSESGACKGRAYPTHFFHHTHCILNVSMLTKQHRDAAFTKALLGDLEAELRAQISQSCFLSLGIDFSDDAYVTTEITI